MDPGHHGARNLSAQSINLWERGGVLCLVDLVRSTEAIMSAATVYGNRLPEALLCGTIGELQRIFVWHGAETKVFTGDGLLFFFPAQPRSERVGVHLTAALTEAVGCLDRHNLPAGQPLGLRAAVHAGTISEVTSTLVANQVLGYDALYVRDYCEAVEDYGLTRAAGATVAVSRRTLDDYRLWSDQRPVPRRKPFRYAPITDPFFLMTLPKMGGSASRTDKSTVTPSAGAPEVWKRRHGLLMFLEIVPAMCSPALPNFQCYVQALGALFRLVGAMGGRVVNCMGDAVLAHLPVPCSLEATLSDVFRTLSMQEGMPLREFFETCWRGDWDVGLRCGAAYGSFYEPLAGWLAGQAVGLSVVLAHRTLLAGEKVCGFGKEPTFRPQGAPCFVAFPRIAVKRAKQLFDRTDRIRLVRMTRLLESWALRGRALRDEDPLPGRFTRPVEEKDIPKDVKSVGPEGFGFKKLYIWRPVQVEHVSGHIA